MPMSEGSGTISAVLPYSSKPNVGARGVVQGLEEHLNSSGGRWITFQIEGPTADIGCVCFPKDLQRLNRDIHENSTVTILGQWSDQGPTHIRVLAVHPPNADDR